MNALAAYADLRALGTPVLETRDAATRLKTTPRNAHRLLRDAEKAGLIAHVRHGLWLLDPGADRQILVPYLTAPYPSYVSLWSALAQHDMIEQIPRTVDVVSLGRTQKIETSRGGFSIHHIVPELFGDFTEAAPGRLIATPEKALFDSVYIRAVQGTGFHPPELTLPARFDRARLEEWVSKISTQRLRTLVTRGIDATLATVEAV
jgi:predicted transcriptional regulator of viral defense system